MVRHGVTCLFALCLPLVALATEPPPERITLENSTIQLQLTPSFGGRVLGVQRRGKPNVLKVGEAVQTHPVPRISADADDIGYLGHDVWVGPQSQWWLHQDHNPARRAAAANWPPDPYLSQAGAELITRSNRQVQLRGQPSPVSGMQLRKTMALSAEREDTVVLEVSGHNIRDTPLAWDLWFNTRLSAATRVFVPVAASADVRVQPPTEAGFAAPAYQLDRGLLSLLAGTGTSGLPSRGKWLVQPSAGWMAGFAGDQVLVIRFAYQPREAIHPEQGQVELYLDAPAHDVASGLLEMEVHAPYRRLAPGERMQSREQWTLLAWTGNDDPAAQRAFLCEQQAALALHGACLP